MLGGFMKEKLLCSMCQENEVDDENTICTDCWFSLFNAESIKLVCPYCNKQSKLFLEYTSTSMEKRRVKSDNVCSYKYCEVTTNHYTCMDCNKGFKKESIKELKR